MAHRLLSTTRKLERLLLNGVKRGDIDTSFVSVFTFPCTIKKCYIEVMDNTFNSE
jgi:hypothetical protein